MSPLKQLLTAPDNLRAVAALAIIADPTRDPEELVKLLPLPQVANLPNGAKRKTYLQRDLVAACYDIAAPPPPPKIEQHEGYQTVHVIIGAEREEGDRYQGLHKLHCFRILTEQCELKLQMDTGKRIIDDCLLYGWPIAMEFAKASKVGKNCPYLGNTYYWMSNRAILLRAIEIGLDGRDPMLIIRCLGFYGCDPNNTYSEADGRDLVIRLLLELGNKPEPHQLAKRILGKADYCSQAYRSGILAEIEEVIDYPWQSTVPGVSVEQVQRAWDDWLEAYEHGASTASNELLWDLRKVCDEYARRIPREESTLTPATV